MQIELTPQQQEAKAKFRAFADENIVPDAEKND